MRQLIASRGMVGILVLLGSVLSVGSAHADTGAGELDPRFSGDGQTAVSFRNDGTGRRDWYSEFGQDVAVRPRGKVVTAGLFYHGGDREDGVGIARLRKNGALDRGFGGDGRVHTRFRWMPGQTRLALAGVGRVLVAGAAGGHFVVARYLADGSLDPGFSVNGKASAAVDQLGEETVDIARDDQGRIMVAGGAGSRAVIVRYTSDGRRDSSFGDRGVVVTEDLGEPVETVGLQPDGTLIVVTQPREWWLSELWRVWRVMIDGTVDEGFVSEVPEAGYEDDVATAVAVQDDGRVIVAGHGWFGDNSSISVVRYNSDGSLDETFGGGDGQIGAGGPGPWDHAYAVAVQANGKILIGGDTQDQRGPSRMRLYRVNPDGTPDLSFSGDGVASAQTPDPATAIAIRGGRIVVVGDAWLPQPAGSAFGLARFYQASH